MPRRMYLMRVMRYKRTVSKANFKIAKYVMSAMNAESLRFPVVFLRM